MFSIGVTSRRHEAQLCVVGNETAAELRPNRTRASRRPLRQSQPVRLQYRFRAVRTLWPARLTSGSDSVSGSSGLSSSSRMVPIRPNCSNMVSVSGRGFVDVAVRHCFRLSFSLPLSHSHTRAAIETGSSTIVFPLFASRTCWGRPPPVGRSGSHRRSSFLAHLSASAAVFWFRLVSEPDQTHSVSCFFLFFIIFFNIIIFFISEVVTSKRQLQQDASC